MSKKLLLSLTIMAGVLFVGASPALATNPPLVCTGVGAPPANVSQYNMGKRLGALYASQAWRSAGQDPNRFEEVADLVRESVSNAILNLNDASDRIKCRAKGMSQGVCDELSNIQDGVVGRCLLDGEVWGALSGDLYCALAIEFGGADIFDLLPVAPTNLCGTNFVNACEGQFDVYVDTFDACEDYNLANAEASYLSWQGGMCSYEIP
jgi:hypothetical protein